MSAEILPFHPPAIAAPMPGRSRQYSFADVVRELALADAERRTQVDHLRLYAAQAGMPLPMNLRKWRGQVLRGADAIGTRSKWCAMEFDAWLERGRTPPPVAAALDAPTPPVPLPVRAAMRDRALHLAGAGR